MNNVHIDHAAYSIPMHKTDTIDGKSDREKCMAVAYLITGGLAPGSDESLRPVPALRHYLYAWAMDETGLRIDVSLSKNQGSLVTLHGKYWHGRGDGQAALIDIAGRYGGHFTRVDIAVDLFYQTESPAEVYAQLADNPDEIGRMTIDLRRGPSGQTLYVGSRTSQYMLRVYDKAAEQKVEIPWIRAELEVKGEAAKAINGSNPNLLNQAVSKMARMIRASQGEIWLDLDVISGGSAVLPGTGRRTRGNTQLWIESQVIPALGRLHLEDPGGAEEVMEKLILMAAEMKRSNRVDNLNKL